MDVAGPGSGGGRLLIAPYAIQGLTRAELPARVRVTVGPQGLIGPGQAVRLRAILGPPPDPASPGAYDFARDSFFQRVGGVGFSLTEPTIVQGPRPPPLLGFAMGINAARWALARRMIEDMGAKTGGDRGGHDHRPRSLAGPGRGRRHAQRWHFAHPVDLGRAHGHRRGLRVLPGADGHRPVALGGGARAGQEGGRRRGPSRHRRLPRALGRAGAGGAFGRDPVGGLRGDPGRPAGDQPARPGRGGPDRAGHAARGGDPAGLSDVLRRHRRPGGARSGVAEARA